MRIVSIGLIFAQMGMVSAHSVPGNELTVDFWWVHGGIPIRLPGSRSTGVPMENADGSPKKLTAKPD